MRFFRRSPQVPTGLLLMVLLALPGGAGADPGEDRQPVHLDSLEAQEAAADILDTYERILKQLYPGRDGEVFLDQIETARGLIFRAPPEELKLMGEIMGEELLQLRRLARDQAAVLLPDGRRGPFGDLSMEALEKDGTQRSRYAVFPKETRTDLPAYPELLSVVGDVTEGSFEEEEAELEEREDELEDSDIEQIFEFNGVCDVALRPNPSSQDDSFTPERAERESHQDLVTAFHTIFLVRLLDDVLHDLCGGTSAISCSVCCIPSTIARAITEVVWDTLILCEDLIDSAEIEATYHNTETIFHGLAHAHNNITSLHGKADDLSDQVTDVGVQVTGVSAQVADVGGLVTSSRSALSSQMTSTRNALSGQLSSVANSLGSQLASARNALSAELASAEAALSSQLSDTEDALSSQLSSAESSLSSQLTDAEGNLSGQLTDAEQNLETQLEAARQALADQLTDFEALDVQVQIEQTLIANDKVALFQLPQSAGGFLELVRDVVEDAIQRVTQAGEDPGNADKHLGEGDERYAEGQYKKAYERYSKAYKELVK